LVEPPDVWLQAIALSTERKGGTNVPSAV